MKIAPTIFQDHTFYMQKAMKLAHKAFLKDEVPVGAVLVNADGVIVARSYNAVETKKCQLAHAELRVIEKACKAFNDWRLQGCWLYVTLEPCVMCLNAAILSRIAGIVYGASSPLFGFTRIDKGDAFWLYKKDVIVIIDGVCSEESAHLLQKFFKQKRKSKSE